MPVKPENRNRYPSNWSDLVEAELPPALTALQQAAVQVRGRQVQNAGTIGGIFRNTAKDLRQSTLRTFFEVCECVNWEQGGLKEGKHYRFNETKGEVSWYNGSKTYFDYLSYEPSDPNYSRFGGRAYTRCGVGEADECEERGVTMVGTRIIYRLTDFCHACAAQNMADLSEPLDCDDNGTPCLWR